MMQESRVRQKSIEVEREIVNSIKRKRQPKVHINLGTLCTRSFPHDQLFMFLLCQCVSACACGFIIVCLHVLQCFPVHV